MLKSFIIVIFSQEDFELHFYRIYFLFFKTNSKAVPLCSIMVVENMKAPASANEKGIAAGQDPTLAVLFSFVCGSNIYNL
jgi:hypothetical protein